MITLQEAEEYLSHMGINAPDSVVEIHISMVERVWECLTSNYGEAQAKLMGLYALTIMLISAGASKGQLSARSAPSGASESFTTVNPSDVLASQSEMLQRLDTQQCLVSILPRVTTSERFAGLWVSRAY